MSGGTNTTLLASELRIVLGQLARKLRAGHRLSLSQGAVLGRLEREGTSSIGELAAAEHVRPQSMTHAISDLAADGMVARSTDPTDGRRSLVALTDRGRLILDEDRRERDGWLATAIADDLSEHEQELLAQALQLLRRLADAPRARVESHAAARPPRQTGGIA